MVCILWGRRAGWQARYVWIAEAGGRTLAVCAPRCGGREAALGGWRPSLAEPRWRQSRGAQAADATRCSRRAWRWTLARSRCLAGRNRWSGEWREREAPLLLGWRHGQRPCAEHSADCTSPAPSNGEQDMACSTALAKCVSFALHLATRAQRAYACHSPDSTPKCPFVKRTNGYRSLFNAKCYKVKFSGCHAHHSGAHARRSPP